MSFGSLLHPDCRYVVDGWIVTVFRSRMNPYELKIIFMSLQDTLGSNGCNGFKGHSNQHGLWWKQDRGGEEG